MSRRLTFPRLLAIGLFFAAAIGALVFAPGCSKVKGKYKAMKEPGPYTGYDIIAELRAEIREEVADPNRAKQMLKIVDDMDADMHELDKRVIDFWNDLAALHADYDSTPEQFREQMEEFNEFYKGIRDRFLDNRFKINKLALVSEWKEISDLDNKLMDSWQRLPGQD